MRDLLDIYHWRVSRGVASSVYATAIFRIEMLVQKREEVIFFLSFSKVRNKPLIDSLKKSRMGKKIVEWKLKKQDGG